MGAGEKTTGSKKMRKAVCGVAPRTRDEKGEKARGKEGGRNVVPIKKTCFPKERDPAGRVGSSRDKILQNRVKPAGDAVLKIGHRFPWGWLHKGEGGGGQKFGQSPNARKKSARRDGSRGRDGATSLNFFRTKREKTKRSNELKSKLVIRRELIR